jgi:hypothetical protein
MTFEDWFNQIENFSLRSERFYELLEAYKNGRISESGFIDWLKAAYHTGHEHAMNCMIDDGK